MEFSFLTAAQFRLRLGRRACAAAYPLLRRVLEERGEAVSVVSEAMESARARRSERTPNVDAGSACLTLFSSSLLRCTAKSLKSYRIG
jgi:hypothetical protein